MNAVLSFIKILDVEFEEIAHDVVEHEEAGGFLNRTFISIVEEIEDRSYNLIHSLDVLSSWVHFCEDKQNSSHIVISIGLAMLLFMIFPIFNDLLIILSIHQLPFLLPHSCHERNHHRLNRSRKESQLRLGP